MTVDANDIARKHGSVALRKVWDAASVEGPRREPGRIELVPFNEISLGRERRYLVKGLIPNPGLSVIWGPPKSGKSFWTFDLVMHVALGWEYRGREFTKGQSYTVALKANLASRPALKPSVSRFKLTVAKTCLSSCRRSRSIS